MESKMKDDDSYSLANMIMDHLINGMSEIASKLKNMSKNIKNQSNER